MLVYVQEFRMACLQLLLILTIVVLQDSCLSQAAVAVEVNLPRTTHCEFYNETMCTESRHNGGGTGCNEKEECEMQDPGKRSHCFVLWRKDSNGNMNITLKGCFLNNEDCYNKTECIERAQNPKKDFMFCCCEGNMCNQNFTWKPTPTEPPVQNAPEPVPMLEEQNYLIIGLIVGAVLMISIGVLVILYRHRKNILFNELPTTEPHPTPPPSPQLGLRPIQLIEIKARGRFGAVYKALLNKSQEVAVKIFPIQDKQSWLAEQEIYKLPHMDHPNILHYVGVEKRGGDNLHAEFWLITEYHELGSLCDYLKAYTVTWQQLCLIAETMSKGLMHLHEEIPGNKLTGFKPALAHRDFKSKNVLLKQDKTDKNRLVACIADFGLALVFQPGKPCGDTHGQVGTRRYMAPEVLEGAINFTRDAFLRIDMYACGLVLWELASRCGAQDGPIPEYRLPFEEEVGQHPTLEDMQESVVQGKVRPTIPATWRQHKGLQLLCDTMEECWDHDAEARLSASCVMERVALHNRYHHQNIIGGGGVGMRIENDGTPLPPLSPNKESSM